MDVCVGTLPEEFNERCGWQQEDLGVTLVRGYKEEFTGCKELKVFIHSSDQIIDRAECN